MFTAEPNAAQQLILAVFLAALGGCIGSFLNVVIYRMPRGKSLVHPGSACPKCGHEIRWFHNVPVLGWLLLRGRCYDCGAAISARYPLVEATLAGVFLALGWVGPLASGGEQADPSLLWGVYGLQVVLVCCLFSLAMIERDGDAAGEVRYPWFLFAAPAGGVLAAQLVWPQLPPGLTQSLLGAAAGLGMGLLALPAFAAGAMGKRGRLYGLLNAVLVGLFVGPQTVVLLAAGATLLNCLWVQLRRPPAWSLFLWIALVVGWLVPFAPGPMHPGVWIAASVLTLIGARISRP